MITPGWADPSRGTDVITKSLEGLTFTLKHLQKDLQQTHLRQYMNRMKEEVDSLGLNLVPSLLAERPWTWVSA